jgi:hypothetical protein
MTRSFQKRLFLLSLVWALVSIPLLTYHFHMTWQNSEQSARQFLHKDLARHMRDENPLLEGNDYSPKTLKSIFHTLMMLGPYFEIYFLDKTGKITTTGLKEGVEFAPRVDIAPIKQFLKGGNLPILVCDIALILLFTFLIYRLIKKDLLNPSQRLFLN